jgi:hypothetical protein
MSDLTEQAIFFELSVLILGLQSREVVENFSDSDLFLLPCGIATCEISPTKYRRQRLADTALRLVAC